MRTPAVQYKRCGWVVLVIAAVGCGEHRNSEQVAQQPSADAGTRAGSVSAAPTSTDGAAADGGALAPDASSAPRPGMLSDAGRAAPAPADSRAGSSAPDAARAGSSASGRSGSNAGSPAGAAGAPAANGGKNARPTLFYLNVSGAVLRANADGSDRKQIVGSAAAGTGPDGIAVDTAAGHIYWTDMGVASRDDGTVMRADLDGKNVTEIIKAGGTFTPKQLKIDVQHGKLYWSDREGMRVMRANLDGSNLETLVVTGSGDADRRDASRWCVGIALDVAGGKLYWSQKGGDNAHQGTIKRAALALPPGQDPATRADIEVLFAALPEPVDVDLDLEHRVLYWTDRGDNTVSRAPLDVPPGTDPATRSDRQIVVKGLGEAIGVWVDAGGDRIFYTSIAGVVGVAALDGSMARSLLTNQGSLTGIALADLPQ